MRLKATSGPGGGEKGFPGAAQSSQKQAEANSILAPLDPDLHLDGAAHRVLLLRLGPADAHRRVLPGLPPPPAVAAHLCAHPVWSDAGLRHGSHIFPHGLSPGPL